MELHRYEPRFTVIDLDPHWLRVTRGFRLSDLAAMFAVTCIGPAVYIYNELIRPIDPTTPWKFHRSQFTRSFFKGMRIPTIAALMGGYLVAYHRSSERFWGWKENQREIDWDRQKYLEARKKGLPHHLGETELSDHLKSVAYRHSRFAAEFFAVLPFLNFTHHNLGVNWDLYKDLEPQI